MVEKQKRFFWQIVFVVLELKSIVQFHLLAQYKFDSESDSDSDAYFAIRSPETPISLRSICE